MEEQSIFDVAKTPLKIDKPIRLIELFAGIGSQAKAIERLNVGFEHYRVCDFDKYAIKSYNAIHGTNFVTSDITQIAAGDLGIMDTDQYCYVMTYSFPCQDLSVAGKGMGMAKGDNTRSGLLWEVERLLNECTELPQILLMENVTQVHGTKNKKHFDEWIAFLESKGYSNYWKDLNAKNFGIPQNRNRTFMVSVLGDYSYEFPKEFPLQLRLKDMLEDVVDEKFYIKNFDSITAVNKEYSMINGGTIGKMHDVSRRVYSEEGVSPTIHTCGGGNTEPKVIAGIGEKKSNGGTQWYQQDRIYDDKVAISVTTAFNPYYAVQKDALVDEKDVAEPFICASRGRNPDNPSDRTAGIHLEQRLEPNFSGCTNTLTTVQKDNYVVEPFVDTEPRVKRIGKINSSQDGVVVCSSGIAPTHTAGHGNAPKVAEGIRIRKLTPKECWRLMGFDDADFKKAAAVNSNSQLYKQAGNSIVVDVLYYIFRQMF